MRPSWRAARPWIVLGLAVATLVLGTIGFYQYADEKGPPEHYDVLDSLLHAITLFGFNVALNPPPDIVELNIARVIAPLLTGYAALRGLVALFRDQAQLLFIWGRMRRHVVVAGLGQSGFRLAKAFSDPEDRNGGFPVVAIERDPNNPAILGCRERGISVLKGDATDHAVLRKAMMKRAACLLVTSGEDGRKMDVVAAAASLPRQQRLGPLTAFVSLDDVDLWRQWTAAVLAAPDRSPSVRFELFHIADLAARALLHSHPAFSPVPVEGERPHVLITGLEDLGESLIIHMARSWQETGRHRSRRLPITIAGPGAVDGCPALMASYPELDVLCELNGYDLSLESTEFREGSWPSTASDPITAAYVCFPHEGVAVKAALTLATRTELRRVPIVVAVEDAGAGAARALRDGPVNVHAYGVLERALTPRLLRAGTNEIVAQEMHEGYVRFEQSKGITKEQNELLVPWRDLSGEDREANLAFVDGIGAKLRMIGCTVVPAPLIDPNGPLDELPNLEVLAIEEHERWCTQKRSAGWRHAAVRNNELKLHPDLVDWSELAEEARNKDREAVRTIPVKLARAGFRVVGPGGDLPQRSSQETVIDTKLAIG